MQYKQLANAIRFLSLDMVEKAKSGHPGLPLGMADVATVLFHKFLRFMPNYPKWQNRDRFVLSAGHGSAMLYSLLHMCGYKDFDSEALKNFRQLSSVTAGHPESFLSDAIETTTGPLGQGIANAVGMAIAERHLNARFGDELIDHKVYVICSDGDLMEGISHESLSLAGHLQLKNLVILFDDNSICIDGDTSTSCSDNHLMRMQAYGFATHKIDGHNYEEIEKALSLALKSDKPTFIACKTIIGFGSPNMAGTAKVHGSPLGADEYAETKKHFNWQADEFQVPEETKSAWSSAYKRNEKEYNKWQEIYENSELAELLRGNVDISPAFAQMKKELLDIQKSQATRASSGFVLQNMVKIHKMLIGGSADLSGSNCTMTEHHKAISKNDYTGNYIHYGVREHAMAAIMNGITLSGLKAYGGTFLVFSDYARPSIRLSALMKLPVVYVMTHDSIGLGEDGPTHQPVEHLAALRAMPNLNVFRPADAIETAECWEIALSSKETPSILALSRQNLEQFRYKMPAVDDNLCKKGAYVIKECKGAKPDITIFASGSEVEIAMATAKILEEDGNLVRVVSMPSLELFFKQDREYQMSLLDNKSLKVAIEAGVSLGIERIIGMSGVFCGMNSFGASAPYGDLYDHFELTPEKCAARIKKFL